MKRTEYDRDKAEQESLTGKSASLDELEKSAKEFFNGKRRGTAVVDADYRKRMHAALDDLLGRLAARRRCAGDRQRGRR